MGILALILGVVAVLAMIGACLMYVATMLLLAAFGVSAMIAFGILYAVLGEEHVAMAVLLALPIGLLCVGVLFRDHKGET